MNEEIKNSIEDDKTIAAVRNIAVELVAKAGGSVSDVSFNLAIKMLELINAFKTCGVETVITKMRNLLNATFIDYEWTAFDCPEFVEVRNQLKDVLKDAHVSITPTEAEIKSTLVASCKVWLAKGYLDEIRNIHVYNFDKPAAIQYPEVGKFNSFNEIKQALEEEIDKKLPKSAFPYREISNHITLFKRDPKDTDYLTEIGKFPVNVE